MGEYCPQCGVVNCAVLAMIALARSPFVRVGYQNVTDGQD